MIFILSYLIWKKLEQGDTETIETIRNKVLQQLLILFPDYEIEIIEKAVSKALEKLIQNIKDKRFTLENYEKWDPAKYLLYGAKWKIKDQLKTLKELNKDSLEKFAREDGRYFELHIAINDDDENELFFKEMQLMAFKIWEENYVGSKRGKEGKLPRNIIVRMMGEKIPYKLIAEQFSSTVDSIKQNIKSSRMEIYSVYEQLLAEQA